MFQASQDKSAGETKEGTLYEHKVNCCCVLKVCDQCLGKPVNEPCVVCTDRKKVFTGENALDEFCSWLFTEPNKGDYAMAHNCRG